jgi:hypothetical protein
MYWIGGIGGAIEVTRQPIRYKNAMLSTLADRLAFIEPALAVGGTF